jgi:hypothetical protein
MLTLQDLDYMLEQDLLKFYRIYQTNVAVRATDTFSKIAIHSYTKLACWLLTIKSEEQLYDDLRNDYLLSNELDQWIGYLCLKLGSLTALTSNK